MALNQLSGKQLRDSSISNQHIAADAAIAESKLNVAWDTHYHNALQTKKVLDYVQLNSVAVTAGLGSFEIPHGAAAGNISLAYAATVNDYGVVGTKAVILRDHATGLPITVGNKEVFGIVTYDGTGDKYVIAYNTGSIDVPTPVMLPDGVVAVDLQYMARFNLDTVDESFAANEKFVDGMADVSETANLSQIVKDVFGAGYALDSDGNANLAKSLTQTVSDETHGVTNNTTAAKDVIDEVVTARDTFGNLDARFDADETRVQTLEQWKSTNNTLVHQHVDEVGVSDGTATYTLVRTDIKSTDFMSVYLNGVRQAPNNGFTKTIVDGKVTALVFQGTVEAGWEVYIEAAIYNS